MKTFNLTFTAGETKQLPSGVHLELITTTDAVNITYKKNQTELNEKATSVNAGYFFTMPKTSKPIYDESRKIVVGFRDVFDTFDLVEIYSATAQTIVVGITQGDGGSRSTATNLVGGTVDTVTNPLQPQTLSSSDVRALGSTLVTLVTPAANTAGVRIDSINFTRHTNDGSARLMSKTSAPSSYSDNAARTLLWTFQNATVALYTWDSITLPVIVPAGEGLYLQGSAANVSWSSVNYEVL